MYPNVENMFLVPNQQKNGDYYKNLYLPYGWINFVSKKNGGIKKPFL